MRSEPARLLVISDAGLPALVTSMLWPEPEAVSLWVPPLGAPLLDSPALTVSERHVRAAEAQADLLGLSGAVRCDAAWDDRPMPVSRLLMLACGHAAATGADTVVWPAVCGADLEALAEVSDRARLVGRLWTLDSSGRTPSVRTPLADLTAREVADLALDLDAPLEALWWRMPPDPIEADADETDLRLHWEGAVREAARAAGFVGSPGETPAGKA